MKTEISKKEDFANTLTSMSSTAAAGLIPTGRKNNFEDTIWYIYNNFDDNHKIINWTNYDVNERWKPLVKTSLLGLCGGYTSLETQDIYNSGSSIKSFLGTFKRFLNMHDEIFGDQGNLCELDLKMIRDILSALLVKNAKLSAHSTAADYVKLILRLKKDYSKGLIHDGIEVKLPKDVKKFLLQDIVASQGLEWGQWLKGGSFATIPASLAMLLLARCLEINNSLETKVQEIYFECIRKLEIDEEYFWSPHWKSDDGILGRISNRINSLLHADETDKWNEFKLKLESVAGQKPLFFTKKEFNAHLHLIYDYLTTGFVLLTGFRLIEIRHITGGDIKIVSESEIEFPTTPRKTKHFPTVRAVSSLTTKFVHTLINCSPSDKLAKNLPIFERTSRNSKLRDSDVRSVPDNTMRHRINDCWIDFTSTVSIDPEEAMLGISPHALRHVWVDIALRCNVPENNWNTVTEQIRHHLRHSYGANWTRRYMDGKFTKEQMRELEQNYFQDLFRRIGGEDDPEFFGPIAKRIRKALGDAKFVDVTEVSEIETLVQDMTGSLVSLNTHPWGLCVLMKETEIQAKCYDKKTNMPDTEKKSSFENCSGCVHRLTHKSNEEYIQRLVLVHQNYLENYPLKAASLRKVSEEAIAMGERILMEMKE